MQAYVKAWGNSYAIRLTKRDLQRLGIRPGQPVNVEVTPLQAPPDLQGIPTVRDKDNLSLEEVRRMRYRSKQRWEG